MAKSYLDKDGLLYFWQKIKSAFVTDVDFNSTTGYITKTKNGTTSNVVALPDGASASSTTPKMNGTAAVGSETAFARGDHVHPTDTSRASTAVATTSANGLMSSEDKSKLDGIASGATADDHKWDDVGLSKATTGYNSDTNVRYIPVLTETTSTTSTLIPTVVGSDAIQSSSLAYRMPRYNASGYLHGTTAANGDATAKLATTLFVYNQFVSKIGQADGICPLDSNSKVSPSFLPSYVDDVIEAYPRSGQTELSQNWLSTTSGGSALTPETGKIYVLMAASTNYDANTQFRWSGSAYVKLADGGVSSITNAEIDTIVAA